MYIEDSHGLFYQDAVRSLKLHSQCLSIILVNTRLVLNKHLTLSTLASTCRPPLIRITEAWCTSEISDDSLRIEKYNLFRGDRRTGRGGGTLIYCEQSIHATQFSNPILSQLNDSIWVKIKVVRSKPILVGCVYQPWDFYQHLIRCSNWDLYLPNESLEAILNNFYQNINSVHDVIAPRRILSFRFPPKRLYSDIVEEESTKALNKILQISCFIVINCHYVPSQ
uniref:Uncharacterized protein n=1 Tax=Trichobilharzia regenti TaxID=157069 RepID=A0AA85JCK2_TRIRE|nr:unnamed protein product [Trichobilharzia regenti]